MKVIKFVKNDLEIVRNREEVLERLNKYFKPCQATRLYNFYCAIQLNGEDIVKKQTADSTYRRNIKILKDYSIDFSQSYILEEKELFYFNPFEFKEVI